MITLLQFNLTAINIHYRRKNDMLHYYFNNSHKDESSVF